MTWEFRVLAFLGEDQTSIPATLGGSQLSVTPASRHLSLSSDLQRHLCPHECTHKHTHRIMMLLLMMVVPGSTKVQDILAG